jgi:hypothetical protein
MKKKIFLLILAIFLSLVLSAGGVLAEDKPSAGQNSGTPQVFSKLPKTPNDPLLRDGKVDPMWGPLCQRYTYSVIYSDKEGRPPEYVRMYFNGSWIDMEKETASDSNYKTGVKYIHKFVPTKYGSNFYFFEASNGLGKARDSIIDSPDNGPVLFEGDFKDNEVAIIDSQRKEKIWRYSLAEEWVGGLDFSADGEYLAVQTTSHVYLFKRDSEKPLWDYKYNGEYTVENNDVKGGIAISGDGTKIFAEVGNSVLLFSRNSNKPIWQKNLKTQGYNVAISKDGKYLAAALAGGGSTDNASLLILWSAEKSEPLWQYEAAGNFHDLSFSEDGSYLAAATGCPDRRAYIFSKDSKEPVLRSEMLTRDSPVNRARISADGYFAAFSAEYENGLVFAFKNPAFGGGNQPLWSMPSTKNHRSGRGFDMTPDGKNILETTFAGEVILLGPENNTPRQSWKFDRPLAAAAISNDGQIIAVGGTAGKVYILQPSNASSLAEISFDEYIGEIAVSSDGRYIAAGTSGSNYFFESFISDEKTEVKCDKIIEPKAEAENNQGQETNNQQEIFWFIFLSAGVFLISAVWLTLYIIIKKRRQNPLNKIIIGVLSVLIAISAGYLVYDIFFKKAADNLDNNSSESIQSEENSSQNATTNDENSNNQSSSNQSQSTGNNVQSGENSGGSQNSGQPACGNGLCEPNAGENQTNCPRDCSAGN